MVKDKTNRSVVVILGIVIVLLCAVLATALRDSKSVEEAIDEIKRAEETAEVATTTNTTKTEEVTVTDGKVEVKSFPEDSSYDFSDGKWKKPTDKKFFITIDEDGKTVIEDEEEKVVLTLNVGVKSIQNAYCKKWTNTLTIETAERCIDYDLEKKTTNVYEVK